MADWKLILPLIGTLLSGGILVSAINFFYSDFLNQPSIIIKVIEPEDENAQAEIEISNRGWDPAHNLVLQILAPKNVTHTWIQSSENITITHNSSDPKKVKAYAPRFVHGEGSISKIFMRLDRDDTNDVIDRNYSVYSTFDEGSSTVLYPPSPGEGGGILDILYLYLPAEWYKFYVGGGFINLIFWIVVFGIFLGLLAYSLSHFISRRTQSLFINDIIKQIRIAGGKLKEDKKNLESFRKESDRSISARTTEIEDNKYFSNGYSYASHYWVPPWTVPRQSIWDLWYTKSDDYKMQAFPPTEYDNIRRFYLLLMERELLVDFRKSKMEIMSKPEKGKVERNDERWPFNLPESIRKKVEQKKLTDVLKPYLGEVGDAKWHKIFRLLEGDRSTSIMDKAKIGESWPIFQRYAEEKPVEKDAELNYLKSLFEKIKGINKSHIENTIIAKNSELLTVYDTIIIPDEQK